jgi:hypothetical protein
MRRGNAAMSGHYPWAPEHLLARTASSTCRIRCDVARRKCEGSTTEQQHTQSRERMFVRTNTNLCQNALAGHATLNVHQSQAHVSILKILHI